MGLKELPRDGIRSAATLNRVCLFSMRAFSTFRRQPSAALQPTLQTSPIVIPGGYLCPGKRLLHFISLPRRRGLSLSRTHYRYPRFARYGS